MCSVGQFDILIFVLTNISVVSNVQAAYLGSCAYFKSSHVSYGEEEEE